MEDLTFIYREIILEFLFELYVFYGLTFFTQRRRPHFWARAAGGLAAVLVVAVGAAAAYQLWGDTVLGRIGVYLVLFAVTVVQMQLCFEPGLSTVVFCCSMAYASQNLGYKLRLMVWDVSQGVLYELWDDGHFAMYYRISYAVFFAVTAVAVYFIFIRRVIRHLNTWQMDRQMLTLCIFVLVIAVFLCSVEDIYFNNLSVQFASQTVSPEFLVLKETGNLFSVTCCAIVLQLACRTLEQRELKQEVEYLQYTIRQSRRQYEIAKDTIDLINIKCHDIRYKLASLAAKGGKIEEDAMRNLQKSISIYDAKIETGNQSLDVLLTEKSLYCEQNGITFSCMADGEKLDFLDGSDLYCLFGNIVDNALEAVKAISEQERRVINLLVKAQGNLLMIQEDNYFDGTLTFRDGLPVTTKEDKNYHGFGMRSIRMIVRKYDGELTTYVDGDVFHLNILFGTNGK